MKKCYRCKKDILSGWEGKYREKSIRYYIQGVEVVFHRDCLIKELRKEERFKNFQKRIKKRRRLRRWARFKRDFIRILRGC